MKRPVLVLVLLFCFLWVQSQKIQVIVPGQVVVGNAFQLQYIINDPGAFVGITSPQLENLRLVSGPNYYKGTSLVNGKEEQIENITFTVVPLKPGKVRINAITARFKNSEERKSDDIVLTVLPQPKASFNTTSTYTDINLYAPSTKADLDKLINANLFIRTEVDKHVCFLGEAITATFKLYSRLQSTSEVINAPSLYGFSVMDMLDINEAHQAVETIDGKIFNTSILRRLQLFPAQTGKLSVDPMELQNTIEFSDSLTNKKMQVERLLASPPVEILVKPLPSKEPVNYTGAVGQFSISADIPRSTIAANAQGKVVITIAGTGNFLQFGPPLIVWPKEFEVFDPVVSDEINKEAVPTQGKRTYLYSFTAERPGSYTV
ncbi:MAG: BatD family protein, partial [Flavisolibacter sp.]